MIFKITAVWLIIINMIAFIAYGIDKHKAIIKKWRTPEALLIFLALIGGAPGALIGMFVFRHKTRKPKFFITVPLLTVIWIYVAARVVSEIIRL